MSTLEQKLTILKNELSVEVRYEKVAGLVKDLTILIHKDLEPNSAFTVPKTYGKLVVDVGFLFTRRAYTFSSKEEFGEVSFLEHPDVIVATSGLFELLLMTPEATITSPMSHAEQTLVEAVVSYNMSMLDAGYVSKEQVEQVLRSLDIVKNQWSRQTYVPKLPLFELLNFFSLPIWSVDTYESFQEYYADPYSILKIQEKVLQAVS